MFRFGPFTFDPESGDLLQAGARERLTPQSASVLGLLLERSGGVVSRAELRDRIWPDTTVEFDQGLSFCIRQLRVALSDDAARPTYIETLPRRGYRFIAAVDRVAAGGATVSTEPVAPIARVENKRRRPVVAVALLLLVLASAFAIYVRGRGKPTVLAIVPFDAMPDSAQLIGYRDALSEAIVEGATSKAVGSLSVVGPSTTKGFTSRTLVDSIRARTGSSYALSGTVRRRGIGLDVFAQLIRSDDRAHIWVARWLDSSASSSATLGSRIADSVVSILSQPQASRRPALRERRTTPP